MSSERQYNLLYASAAWIAAVDSTAASNQLQVTIAANALQRIQLGLICLSNEAGGGGSPTINVQSNSIDIWNDTYSFGSGYTKDFGNPLPAFDGQNLVVTAAATALTGGDLVIAYRLIPVG
jgi:hypothetical protein